MLRMTMLMLAAVLLGGLGACSDSSAPEPDPRAITGTVLDEAGMPVAGAAVLLDLDFVEQVPLLADKPRTMIQFVLPDSGRFTLRITDACDDEVFYGAATRRTRAAAISSRGTAPTSKTACWPRASSTPTADRGPGARRA